MESDIYDDGEDALDAGLAERHQQLQWVARVQQALENGKLVLNFQPIVGILNDLPQAGHRFEFLLRLRDGDGEALPGEFLPAVEHYNLAAQLDRWVLVIVLQWLQQNRFQLHRLGFCTINLSAASLNDRALIEFLLRRFAADRHLARKICFDIKASIALERPDSVNRFVHIFREQGCQFALEDFRADWNTFDHIRALPVGLIKIDGQLIARLLNDEIDYRIVKSIAEIGHAMGKKIIAARVEQPDALQCLADLGVDFAQGYAVARPRSLQELRLG